MKTLWLNRGLFAGISLAYLLLMILFVRGLSAGTNIAELKTTFGDLGGGLSQLTAGLGLFTVLLTSSGNNSSQTAGAYQTFLLLIISLAIIWALRQVMAGERVRVRDAFYQGMYPMIPVLLVVFMIGVQLLPILIGAMLYASAVTTGVAASVVEQSVFGLLFFGLGLWSLYMIASSSIALYIAALPNMTPLRALRSAKELVRYRRWTILRKLLFLPVSMLLVSVVIMLPIILAVPVLAPWIFFLLSTVGILVIHSYLYTMYRELLP